MQRTPDGMGRSSFAELASGPCPGYAELLLALGAEFGDVDADGTLERLDDASRELFGIGRLAPFAQAERVAAVMGGELGVGCDADPGPDGLHLDRVVQRRRGHAALLAAVGSELAQRAGAHACVYASQRCWYVGLGVGERLVVLDARFGSGCAGEPPGQVRPACAHELAFCVLCGLSAVYAQRGRDADARLAGVMRLALPVQAGG
jgi:hypothetical protein